MFAHFTTKKLKTLQKKLKIQKYQMIFQVILRIKNLLVVKNHLVAHILLLLQTQKAVKILAVVVIIVTIVIIIIRRIRIVLQFNYKTVRVVIN